MEQDSSRETLSVQVSNDDTLGLVEVTRPLIVWMYFKGRTSKIFSGESEKKESKDDFRVFDL